MPAEPTIESFPAPASATGRPPVDDPRVYLAAERTFLAWVRTSVAIMGFGFVIARFAFWMREFVTVYSDYAHRHQTISTYLGFGMVVVGIMTCVVAAFRHRAYIQALRRGVANPPLDVTAAMVLALILALVGIAMAGQLLLSAA